jgi:hypothetical protein
MKSLGMAIVVLGVLGLGYFYLVRSDLPVPSQTAPGVAPPVADVITAPPGPAPDAPSDSAQLASEPEMTEDALLEGLTADLREALPETINERLTLRDAIFLPRMRILELIYVTSESDSRGVAADVRNLVAGRAEAICQQGRAMFELGVTLRNSFVSQDGTLFQRIYTLPEDCL